MRAVPYAAEHATAWDELVDGAPMGTLLHTRRFLSYHGDRFNDRSLVVQDDRDRLVVGMRRHGTTAATKALPIP